MLSSPLQAWPSFHLNKLEYPSSSDALCQVWLKFDPVVLEKKIFKCCQWIFMPLHLNKLNSPSPKDTLFQVSK